MEITVFGKKAEELDLIKKPRLASVLTKEVEGRKVAVVEIVENGEDKELEMVYGELKG